MQLNILLDVLGVGYKYRQLMAGRKLRPWEIFLLKRLIRNLKGSQVGPFFLTFIIIFLPPGGQIV